jgi:hypothetical protein
MTTNQAKKSARKLKTTPLRTERRAAANMGWRHAG